MCFIQESWVDLLASVIRLVIQLVAVARLTALALAQPGCSSLLTTQGRLPSPGANPAR